VAALKPGKRRTVLCSFDLQGNLRHLPTLVPTTNFRTRPYNLCLQSAFNAICTARPSPAPGSSDESMSSPVDESVARKARYLEDGGGLGWRSYSLQVVGYSCFVRVHTTIFQGPWS
jgi:hypothetical protein